jgi:hypothetical protein
MNRPVHVVATVLTSILFSVALTSASPALAATEPGSEAGVALSSNGTTWAPQLTAPLFDQNTRWVPGDRRHASFFVRNDGASDAELVITIETEDRGGLVADEAVSLTTTTTDGARAVPSVSTPTPLGRLAQGASERIDVAALFRGSATNATMRQVLRFTVVVDLSGTPSGRPAEDGDWVSAPAATPPTGLLAYTGIDAPWGVLVAGLAMLTIGLGSLFALVAVQRREHPRRTPTRRRGARS